MKKKSKIVLLIGLCLLLAGAIGAVFFMCSDAQPGESEEDKQTEVKEQPQKTEEAVPVKDEQTGSDDAASCVPDIKRSSSSTKWESDISEIEARYGKELPKGKVVFYGSSSIRKWKTLDEDMGEIEVLNHGFGGSKTSDCLYYSDRMVIAFEPEAVVYYAGTNDIGKGRSVDDAYTDTVDFIAYVHHELPETQIYYISQTQQPKRAGKWDQMQELNSRVAEYARKDGCVTYIDTTKVLNNEDGSCRTELFQKDCLHFNSQGYEEWTSVIRPVLYTNLVDGIPAG